MSLEIDNLHLAVTEELTVRSFILGKAYRLGSELGQTLLGPVEDTAALNALFNDKTVRQLTGWLAALKTKLAPHAAYATSRTLELWQTTRAATNRMQSPRTRPLPAGT